MHFRKYVFSVIHTTFEKLGKYCLLNNIFTKTMKTLVALSVITYLCGCKCEDATTYTTKYDGINLDEILSSERLLVGYINCLLDKGPCTPDGKELKGNLPDAISNDCSKCTERQKEGADQVMHYIIDHRPDDWTQLEAKYEYKSDGSYKKKYVDSKNKKSAEDKDDDDEDNK